MTNPERLFHVTRKESVEQILREGLKPYSMLAPRFAEAQESLGNKDHGMHEVYFVHGDLDGVAAFAVGWALEEMFTTSISMLQQKEASLLGDLQSSYPFNEFALIEFNGSAILDVEVAEHDTYFPGEESRLIPMASVRHMVGRDAVVRTYDIPDIRTAGRELIEFERRARTTYVSLIAGGVPHQFWEHRRQSETGENVRNRMLKAYGKNLVPALTKGWWYRKRLKELLVER